MRRAVLALLCSLLLVPIAAHASVAQDSARPEGVPRAATRATVVAHFSGDRLRVRGADGKRHIVHLSGIDAPEPGECYGAEAEEYLADLAPKDALVWLEESGDDEDENGRWLRYVWVPREDAKAYLLNTKLARDGYAGFDDEFDSPKYFDNIEEAEGDAREADKGLWAACGSVHAPANAATVAEVDPVDDAVSDAADQESPPRITDEERTYVDEMLPYTVVVGDSLVRIADLTEAAGNDPYLIFDQDWTIDVATEFALWQIAYDEVSAIVPPPAFANALLVAALDKMVQASHEIAYGVDNLDAAALERGGLLMQEANGLITEAGLEIDRIVEERGG